MYWFTSPWRMQQLLSIVLNRLEDYIAIPQGVQGSFSSSRGLLRLTGSLLDTHKGSHSPWQRGNKSPRAPAHPSSGWTLPLPPPQLHWGCLRGWSIGTVLSYALPPMGLCCSQFWPYLVLQCYGDLVLQCYGDYTEASPRGFPPTDETYTCWYRTSSLVPTPPPPGLGA